nr:non-ribosomal peptide synthetase [Rhodococcus zopfii]
MHTHGHTYRHDHRSRSDTTADTPRQHRVPQHSLSGTPGIAIGTPVAGRGRAELDDLIGMFVNTLVLRTDVSGDLSFADHLERVRDADLGAFAHADVPFERLVEVLDPPRSQARNPLFQVMLAFEHSTGTDFSLGDLSISAVDFGEMPAKFDLHITVAESSDADELTVRIQYARDLFDEPAIVAFADRFVRVLAAAAARPHVAVGDIDLLTVPERARIRAAQTGVARVIRAGTILEQVSARATRTPDAVAVVSDDVQLSYAQFDARVNRLARELIDRGVGPESRVAVFMARSVDMLVALYAVVAAGGAYVPLDPEHPADRSRYVLVTASPLLVLTTAREQGAVPADADVLVVDQLDPSRWSGAPVTDGDRISPLRPQNTAYVIFTSGSTGRPKGVAVSHGAVANQIAWISDRFDLGADDTVLLKTPFTFDVSVWELFGPLACGARLVVASADGHRDPGYLVAAIRRYAVTLVSFVPSMLDAFVEHAESGSCGSLRAVLAAGEALPARTVARLNSRLPDTAVHNLYGPTEFTVHATEVPVHGDCSVVPIGTAVWNSATYVLDGRLLPVPDGVPGELYLSGRQEARGYLGRPGLTADRFVGDPFVIGGRMYRTGDLVRRNRSGQLEYLGRSDFQVKLRGLRIEPGEIEAVLRDDPQVSSAAVIVWQDRLVAYVTPYEGVLEVELVRREAVRRLPRYMVPETIMVLDALPLNASGKVDRKALPEPVPEDRVYRAPVGSVQRSVAAVFAEVLDVEQVGLDDDFFALGGNSLSATRVAARVGAAVDARIPVRTLFEASTVEGLAAAVCALAGAGGVLPLVRQRRPYPVPLSLAQQRMWFLNRFDSASAVNNVPAAIRLSGALDVDALRCAVGDVVARHEILRTCYPDVDGVGTQMVVPAARARIELAVQSVSERDLPEVVTGCLGVGFDVTGSPPLRVRLLRLSDVEHVLVVVVHHIAADGFSMGPLARDVMRAYASRSVGEAPSWDPLDVQYADYALWQRAVLGSEDDPDSVMSRQVAFWSDGLAGVPEVLELPTDRPRPAVASNRGAVHRFVVEPGVVSAIDALAAEFGVTRFMVVHGVFAVLLARLSGTDDIVIGTPVAGRGERALDDLIGMFVNTLVLRTPVSGGKSFAEMLGRVREVDLGAFGHADVPFERLVEVLDPVRSMSWNPLFQVMLTLQNTDPARFELPGLTVAAVETHVPMAKFDLQLTLSESSDGGFAAEFTYATDLFDEATVVSFAERFGRLLSVLVENPHVRVSEAEILTVDEHRSLLASGRGAVVPLPGTVVPDLLALQAERSPAAVAISAGTPALTYSAFEQRVNRLARHLISLGIAPEVPVAVAMRRSVEMVVALHAVLAAGGVYVPVDPEQPDERLSYLLDTADPRLVLTTSGEEIGTGRTVVNIDALDVSGYASDSIRADERHAALRPQNAAYVLFTSGSTGRPKGVAVSHEAVVNQLSWMQAEYLLNASDVVLLKTPATFDASVWELLWPFASGAQMAIAEPDGHRDPAYLARALVDMGVTVAQFVPTVLDAVLDLVDEPTPALRLVFAGGEALPVSTALRARTWFDAQVHNLYGPTEVTMQATHRHGGEAVAGSHVPIGAPVWNTDGWVLDARMRPVPVGVVGELYLSGNQLARGYAAQPRLTAERFVANPFGGAGQRMYRTGDLARWNRNGELEYAGRIDEQVKLRGQRIELGEIESVLREFDSVAAGAVAVRSDRLVGYVVPDGEVSTSVLRAAMGAVLPSFMVPSSFVMLDALPLNASGKLDRKALPDPVFEVREFRPPVNGVEQAVAAVFEDVLGIERVGLDDDFFALGGNSLVATQVTARLRAELNSEVPLQLLFRDSTVEGLAGLIAGAAELIGTHAIGPMLPLREHGSGTPLICVHPIVGLSWCYTGLARRVDTDIRVYGLQTPAVSEDDFAPGSLEALAERYIDELRKVQPEGPYRLLGWSLGGVIAHAMAVQLQRSGAQVELLVMLDSFTGTDAASGEVSEVSMSEVLAGFDLDPEVIGDDTAGIVAALSSLTGCSPERTEQVVTSLFDAAERNSGLMARYEPERFDGDVVYFTAAEDDPTRTRGAAGWRDAVTGVVRNHPVPSTHWGMTSPEALESIVPILNKVLTDGVVE